MSAVYFVGGMLCAGLAGLLLVFGLYLVFSERLYQKYVKNIENTEHKVQSRPALVLLCLAFGVGFVFCSNELMGKSNASAKQYMLQTQATVVSSTEKEYVDLTIKKLDIKTLTKNLPIYDESHDKSSIGLPRTRWKIKGADTMSMLEYIGDPTDGAQISAKCMTFDSKGGYEPWIKGHPCYAIAVGLMSNVVAANGEAFAVKMLALSGLDRVQKKEPFPLVQGKDTKISIGFNHLGFFDITNSAKNH